MKCIVCRYNERRYPIVEVGSVGDEPHFCPIHKPVKTFVIDSVGFNPNPPIGRLGVDPNRKGGSW